MVLILIHVGKCSGTALYESLQTHKISFKKIHHANQRVPRPILPTQIINNNDNCQFIICIRHPIDRMISAFNYKYTRVILRGIPDYFEGEREGFEYFKNIQTLAENLYNDDGTENSKAVQFCSNCDHIAYGLYHYLQNFNKHHNIKVIRHESLKEDYKQIFNRDLEVRKKSYQPNFISSIDSKFRKNEKIKITRKAYSNLKKFLKQDYQIIDRFADYSLISPQYRDFCHHQLPNNIVLVEN